MELQYHTSSGVLNAVPKFVYHPNCIVTFKNDEANKPFYIAKSFYFLCISGFASCNIKMEKTKSLLINPLRIKQPYDGSIINLFYTYVLYLFVLYLVHLLPLFREQGCTSKADTLFIQSSADFSKRKIADKQCRH